MIRKSDQAALAAAANFESQISHYRGMVYGLAYQMLGNADDARDAAQEALLLAWTRRDQLRDGSSFAGWLRQIAVNVCKMALRSRRSAETITETTAISRDDADATQLKIVVEQALSRLPDDYRLALTLFYLREYSLQEIADFLGVPETTIKSRLRNARSRMQKEWTAMTEQVLMPDALPGDFVDQMRVLFDAAARGDTDTVAKLLRKEPRLLHARGFFGNTVTTEAIRNGHSGLAGDLQERAGALHLPDAAEAGDIVRVREILDADPAIIDIPSPAGFTALCLAAHYGYRDIVEELLSRGAGIDIIASSTVGVAPLHSCLFAREFDIARLLIEWHANVNLPRGGTLEQERTGWTALHYAASYSDADLLRFMIEHGGDPTVQDGQGRTVADIARQHGADAATAVLEQG